VPRKWLGLCVFGCDFVGKKFEGQIVQYLKDVTKDPPSIQSNQNSKHTLKI